MPLPSPVCPIWVPIQRCERRCDARIFGKCIHPHTKCWTERQEEHWVPCGISPAIVELAKDKVNAYLQPFRAAALPM